jgi:hypothetical protein
MLRSFLKNLFFFAVVAVVAATILSNPGSTLSDVLLMCVLIVAYLVPTIVAAKRKHNNVGAILALNVLLGWTFLGWVVALSWSLTDNTSDSRRIG